MNSGRNADGVLSIIAYHVMTAIDAPSSVPMMVTRRTEEAYDRPSLHAELLTLLTSPDAYVAALVLLLGYAASEAVPQHQRGAPRNSSGLLSNVYLDDHEQACPHAHVHPRVHAADMPYTRRAHVHEPSARATSGRRAPCGSSSPSASRSPAPSASPSPCCRPRAVRRTKLTPYPYP